MSGLTAAALALGCLLGLAVFGVIWHLLPATPALGPALRRLHPGTAGRYRHPALGAVAAVVDRLVPASDLAVLGRTRRHYLIGLGCSGLIGLAVGPMLSAAAAMTGWRVPFSIPTIAALGLAVAFVFVARHDVTVKAHTARAAYRRGVCIYLDQVALSAAAGHGPIECLERAAEIGHGPVFACIRATLDSARLRMEPPWDHLRELGSQLRVPALGDLGDIMAASGVGGAHVYRTLRAKSTSLRTQIRFDELAEAKSGSTTLDALGAALVLVLMLISIYPFLARIQLG